MNLITANQLAVFNTFNIQFNGKIYLFDSYNDSAASKANACIFVPCYAVLLKITYLLALICFVSSINARYVQRGEYSTNYVIMGSVVKALDKIVFHLVYM